MLIIGTGYEYKKVFADTLMGSFLVSSLALIISVSSDKFNTSKHVSHNSIVLASVILVCLSALTKQGAIPWAMIFFPLLAYYIINKNIKISSSIKWALLAPVLTPIIWYFTGGENFQNNAGVKIRSMGGRDYLDQLLYSFNEVFINKPSLLIFMSVVFFILFKKINFEKFALATGIVLSTVLMLLFGSYEPTRLYLHVVLIGWLVVFAYEDGVLDNKVFYKISKIGNNFYTYIIVILLFVWWDISKLNQRIETINPVANILDGREVQANWMIGKTGATQYREIVDSKMGLVAPNAHIFGIYYGMDNLYLQGQIEHLHVKGEMDDLHNEVRILSNSPYETINKIKNNNIGWIYTEKSNGSVKGAQDFCDGSISMINTSKNLHEQVLYKVNIEAVNSCIKSSK
jgi:hypothetical protein